MTSRFDRDTSVRSVGNDGSGGVYEARIDPGWWIVDGPNGGYVAAILLRAATDALDDDTRHPLTLTAQYLARPRQGEATVTTAVERVGRSLATVTTRLHQQERLLAIATATFSGPRRSLLEFSDLEPPDVPPPEACPLFPPAGEKMVEINDRYESRWAYGDRPFSRSNRSVSSGWLRTEDAREVDAPLAAAMTDAWIPPVFARLEEPGILAVPTIELTVYLRGPLPRPAGEYVLGVFDTKVGALGYIEEDGELWSEDGVLLAQCRQLAAMLETSP